MYSKSVKKTLHIMGVNPEYGLDDDTYTSALKKYGRNVLPEPARDSVLKKFFLQLKDFMIYTLLGAAAISFAVFYIEGRPDFIEPSIILLIIIMNGIIGVVQEIRAENAVNSLKKMCAPAALALRGGIWSKTPASSLVPGDIIMLETGSFVPADARIIEAENLMIDESSLTGESVPVHKTTKALPEDTPVNDRTNMAYSGCTVCYGHGTAVVTATGSATNLGHVADMLINEFTPDTPLSVRLDKTGKVLSMCFAVLGLSQIAHSFNSKSEMPLLKSGILNNPKLILSALLCITLQSVVICIPALNSMFAAVMLNKTQWLTVILLSLLPIPVVELQKALRNTASSHL